ncbi:type II secretion system F family protein [bacterium]|nr:type II secretion system F family protein [bacterium]
MEQILIGALSFFAVVCIGAAVIANRSYGRAIDERLRIAEPAAKSRATSAETRWARLLRWLGTRASLQGTSQQLEQQMLQAGLFHPHAPVYYLGIKLALLLLGFFGLTALQLAVGLESSKGFVMIAAGTVLLFFAPNFYLAWRRNQHCAEIRGYLPDTVDLLEICVSAGMGLDMAWNTVGGEIRRISPRLADEMALTNLEMHLGVTRADAMRHMADRTGADELGSLVAVMVQSERFGTSISDILKVFATTMREQRSMRAEEKAEKMSVKMIFPMVLFIFPALLIVSVGPALLTLIEVLSY